MAPIRFYCSLSLVLCLVAGCGSKAPEEEVKKTESAKPKKTVESTTVKYEATVVEKSKAKPAFKLGAFGLGGKQQNLEKKDTTARTESVRAALQPLQIMVGTWNALSNQKPPAGFKPNNVFKWQWDYSVKAAPALLMTSDKSNAFLESARLSFSVDEQRFTLTTVDPKGSERTFLGKFTMEVQDVPSDDDPDRTERMYKIEFEETAPVDEKDHWQVVFNQTENNDYRLELARKRSTGKFFRFNTVRNQRDGTSFAKRADDYGDRTCVISQGLGTETVKDPASGKTYWVCCSGCKAAFEDDPPYWIAKFEKLMAEKKK